ncbi:hypothetical protein L6V77_26530 [Myxococcota bacterium]|nr:hypothetical protein [Myxococcota bacterium]
MELRYVHGIRLGALTFDPVGKVASAFWTHRPVRRTPAGQTLASAPLAATWTDVLGVPFGGSVVAGGLRLELLPSGYGPGGAAVLATSNGHRTLVVGPTTTRCHAQPAHALVLCAPESVDPDESWLEAARQGAALRLLPRDAAAAAALSARLAAAGIPHRRPAWLDPAGGEGPRSARVVIAFGGTGLVVDGRPQADEGFLVAFAHSTGAERIYVHGPRADALSMRLREAGLPSRILSAPTQLPLAGLSPVSLR